MVKWFKLIFLFVCLSLVTTQVIADDLEDLDLLETSDLDVLIDDSDPLLQTPSGDSVDISELEESDDLESLKDDIGEDENKEKIDNLKAGKSVFPKGLNKIDDSFEDLFADEIDASDDKDEAPASGGLILKKKTTKKASDPIKVVNDDNDDANDSSKIEIFDVGKEESDLLKLAKYVEGKIPDDEWNDIATAAKRDRYIVQEGDWLWKISQSLFGSGFYYSKIWSLNPHIKNPHEIEPGMSLVFDTGSMDAPPEVKLGSFTKGIPGASSSKQAELFDFTKFGDGVKPTWLEERQKLVDQGLYFQLASEESYEDLVGISSDNLNRDYEKYEPPFTEIIVEEPTKLYDENGFDRDSIIRFDFKEGFFLNTFVTTNIVQDLGYIKAGKNESLFLQKFDKIYVKLDASVKAKPGDQFSVYVPHGKVEHPTSDRSGYRYTITAHVKTLRKINELWECEITDISGLVKRKDRITVYTPKINRIVKSFNKRSIEASVIASYRETANGLSFGDVVYLDRGRADGVELGTVFELYSFIDNATGKKITRDPTYKIGEITTISITDNFSTGLLSSTSQEIGLGALALSKTAESAARASRVKNRQALKGVDKLEGKILDELDVELNLDDINEDLLRRADKVQLTEDELEELERQEKEKSIIKDHEKDLRELERLEGEIENSEKTLNESKLDEDKFLESESLEDIEDKTKDPGTNAFESVNEIEKNIGLKYMDQDLNSRENPYGLTEFDLEEVDELLNTDLK
jgi:hypothetical protein